MTITADLVKELRQRTGGGLLECKKALENTDGDIEAAVTLLRETGKAKADKKSSRIATEGLIAITATPDNKNALMLEVNCETDFVAKDSNFTQFVMTTADIGLAAKVSDVATLMALPYSSTDQTKTVALEREALVTKIGENISVRRVSLISVVDPKNFIGRYVHNGRIGVLVEISGGDEALAKDIAMHIAASSPLVVNPQDVPQDLIAKEKEIYLAQVKESGKPEAIMEKMVQGRLQKFIDELALLNQPFIKEPNTKIAALLKQHNNAQILRFTRFAVGEGIDKEKTDFAAEVALQTQSAKDKRT